MKANKYTVRKKGTEDFYTGKGSPWKWGSLKDAMLFDSPLTATSNAFNGDEVVPVTVTLEVVENG